jgi:hypothetical protein
VRLHNDWRAAYAAVGANYRTLVPCSSHGASFGVEKFFLGFYVATINREISDQYRLTSWRATGKDYAWYHADYGLYDGLSPSHPTLQLI